MKIRHSRILSVLLFLSGFCSMSAGATAGRYIVRVTGGLSMLQSVCTLLGCTVSEPLDGTLGHVFLVTSSGTTPSGKFLTSLRNAPGVTDAESDQTASVAAASYTIPPALYDSKPVDYFGTTVPHGYVSQPASHIIHRHATQKTFSVKGAGTVAVIDTGIDPTHPVFQNSLVPGYDFTRNQDEVDERADVPLTSRPSTDPSKASWTGENSAALVDVSTAAVIDGQYSDFGHGTMVSGVIHLVAPGAKLMPLKAFGPDGTGYTSDIIRATYWAVQHGANIINMSFNLPGTSQEMKLAVDYATTSGLICVAAAGNQGVTTATYPAAYKNVIGVASSTNNDQRSSFSNYGDWVWVAAPGEGVVTTYPYSTYAAGWGTSFSAPLVSGTASLMLDDGGSLLMDILVSQDESDCAKAVAHAKAMQPALGQGRLNAKRAVEAWRQKMTNP